MGQSASKLAAQMRSKLPSLTSKDPYLHGGFQRGAGRPLDREVSQQQFLKRRAGIQQPQAGEDGNNSVSSASPQDGYREMPQDLIKFLNDVGPVEPKEQKPAQRKSRLPRDMTSKAEHQDSKSDAIEGMPEPVSSRQQESMPLVENLPGFVTTRTTSFSHKDDAVDPDTFTAGTVVDMFDLLMRRRKLQTDKTDADREAVQSFYQEHARGKDWSESVQRDQQQQLQNVLRYIELPVVLQDPDDGAYIGAWPDDVTDLEQGHHKMRRVPDHQVKLILQDLFEIERQNKSD